MLPINNFTLKPVESQNNEALTSQVLFDNQPVAEVDELVIEQQFKLKNDYLLFNTYDCPFEEILVICLLNTDFKTLDAIKLGIMYHSGILSDVQVQDENKIKFSFFSDEQWELTVLDKPQFFMNRWKLLGYIHSDFLLNPLMYIKRLLMPRYLKLIKIKD